MSRYTGQCPVFPARLMIEFAIDGPTIVLPVVVIRVLNEVPSLPQQR
jgi:hypothetical protein